MAAAAAAAPERRAPRGRMIQVLVVGHNAGRQCTAAHRRLAYEAGAEVARSGAVLLTGGMGGVMRAASRGAREAGGLVVGILPQPEHSHANEFCDIVIPTGLGLSRDFVNALSADGVVVIGGGAGTLSEVCAAYMHGRPMAAVRGSGGTADRCAGGFVDGRRTVRVEGADTPAQAVSAVLGMIGRRRRQSSAARPGSGS